MALRDNGKTPRRAFLTAGASAAAAVAVHAVSWPERADASHAGSLRLEHENVATTRTTLRNEGDGDALYLEGAGTQPVLQVLSGEGYAIHAEGLFGVVATGREVGVSGGSPDYDAGIGVAGDGRVGVAGTTRDGTGVSAVARELSGTALRVRGRARFSRSGTVTIKAGRRTARKGVPALASDSLVMATIQDRRVGVHIEAAVVCASRDYFTIHLNKVVRRDTRVAWFVLG